MAAMSFSSRIAEAVAEIADYPSLAAPRNADAEALASLESKADDLIAHCQVFREAPK